MASRISRAIKELSFDRTRGIRASVSAVACPTPLDWGNARAGDNNATENTNKVMVRMSSLRSGIPACRDAWEGTQRPRNCLMAL